VQRYLFFILINCFSALTFAKPETSDSTGFNESEAADSSAHSVEQKSLVKSHNADSLFYGGLDYNSFADVFDWLPAAYFFDRGSVGQLAIGSLFAGVEGNFQMIYDGLSLNDPFNGQSDMNFVPVESIGYMNIITSGANRLFASLPLGQTLQLYSKDIASLPIRSTISYRTGNAGYNDIDARLGIKASPKLSINMGGIIKDYSGTVYHSLYDAQKINVNIKRQVRKNWTVEYIYLLNKFDLDVPLMEKLDVKNFSTPHQKDVRVDHGLHIKGGKSFLTTIQLTSHKREFYGYRHSVVDQLHKFNGTRVTTLYDKQLGLFSINSGASLHLFHLDSNDWGNHSQRLVNGWINAAIKSNDKYYLGTCVVIKNDKGYGTFIQQELNMEYQYNPDFILFGWFNHFMNPPQFESLYSQGPYALGDPDLAEVIYSQIGLGLESRIKNVDIYAAATALNIENQIAIDAGENEIRYINQINHTRYSVDFSVKYNFIKHLSINTKGKYTYVTSNDKYFDITNIPEISGKGYIQYQNIFFKGDLDTRIRVGALLIGESFRPKFYFTQYPFEGMPVESVFVPYVHAIFLIKNFTLFFAMQNVLDIDYERVYGYTMPGTQLRWGFTWKFFD